MVWHILSLPFLLLSLFPIVLALVALVVSVVAVISYCSCLRCTLFAVLQYYITYRFFFNQSPVPFSVGLSTTRIPFDGEQLSIRLTRVRTMMRFHVSGMDIEAERDGEAVLWANLNAHELSSSKQSV
jgi:hypothetical protein